MSFNTFRAQTGRQFRVLALAQVTLELIEATQYPGSTELHPSFSLTFRGPLTPALAQETVALEGEDAVRYDMFLVPIARQTDGMLYQAIFN
jgi:hypothetical protein